MTNAPEIKEMLAVARELMREHRRMQLYASVYHGSLGASNMRTLADSIAEATAIQALVSFDAQFPKEAP